MKDIKSVWLGTLSKKLNGLIKDIRNNEGLFSDDLSILS
jgi:hypothetical protein